MKNADIGFSELVSLLYQPLSDISGHAKKPILGRGVDIAIGALFPGAFDNVVLTLNCSGDGRIMTLHEIDGGLGYSIRIPSAFVHQIKRPMLLHRSFYFMICVLIKAGLAEGKVIKYPMDA